MAVILYRYAQYRGLDVSVGEETNILSYSDFPRRSDWAVSALQWALGSGVLEEKGNRIDAYGAVTQKDAAAAMERFDLLSIHAGMLSSWTEDARARNELIAYMSAITDESDDLRRQRDLPGCGQRPCRRAGCGTGI